MSVQMASIVFRCSESGQSVQLLIEEVSHAEDSYVPLSCPGCGKMHFVNRTTRKLLGHEDK